VFPTATEPIPTPQATAIASHPSGRASEAIGTARRVVLMNAPYSGRRGSSFTDVNAPMIAPTEPHADTIPQSFVGLAKWLMKTGGPSTMNPASMKFVIAKPTIGARTQPRDVTSRNPSRSSEPNDRSGARIGASRSNRVRNAALARNDTVSMAKT
jgi:hypothetical protein